MIKIENVVLPSAEQWRAIIMGTRNSMNSWNRSDSHYCNEYSGCEKTRECDSLPGCYEIGPNDHDLMMRLAKAGSEHAKYRRMIVVYADITAPLYWWKEFDTYKVGTVANSCSTIHKIHAKEFTLDDFSCEHLLDLNNNDAGDALFLDETNIRVDGSDLLGLTINVLNYYRNRYLKTKDKKYWWQMIQLLPSSYNQKRTVCLNYEVLANIYRQRKGHKLDEWQVFREWIESLPYSEIITLKESGEQTRG